GPRRRGFHLQRRTAGDSGRRQAGQCGGHADAAVFRAATGTRSVRHFRLHRAAGDPRRTRGRPGGVVVNDAPGILAGASNQDALELLEAAPIAVVILTEEGRYLYRNPAHDKVYRYPAGQVPRLSSEMWVDPEERKRLLGILHREGEVRDVEVQHRRADGEEF